MRLIGMALIGLVLGFVTGIVVSEIIGIIGVLVFRQTVGIRYLSLFLAVAFAIAAPLLDRWRRRSGGRRSPDPM
jgi:hypothetical protein